MRKSVSLVPDDVVNTLATLYGWEFRSRSKRGPRDLYTDTAVLSRGARIAYVPICSGTQLIIEMLSYWDRYGFMPLLDGYQGRMFTMETVQLNWVRYGERFHAK